MKRPFGVTLIGGLLLAQGLFLLASAAAAIFRQVAPQVSDLRLPADVNFTGLAATDIFSAVVIGALGLFIALSGIGVLRLHPWAWLAAMALQGWTLAVFLLDYFNRGQSSYTAALLGVIIVFYLNSRTIRRAFDLARHREAIRVGPPLGAPTATATEPEIHASEATSA